jgi:dienelactone hydrolase
MQGTREVADLRELLKHVPTDQSVILVGWSLGAGVSIAAAAGDARIRGVIAECPYRRLPTPARNMMRTTGMPWRTNLRPALWLLGLGEGTFDRAVDASNLACPLLVIHGDADEISPHEDGEAIAKAAPRGELATIRGGGHQGLWVDPSTREACGHAVAAWLGRLA